MAETKNLLLLLLWNLFILEVHSNCPKSFHCGSLGSLRFPFSQNSNCGFFLLQACDSGTPTLQFGSLESQARYNIVGIDNISDNKITLYNNFRQNYLNIKSCTFFRNLTLMQSPFVSFKISNNLTFFTCLNQTTDPRVQDYFGDHLRVDCHGPPTVYYRNLTTHGLFNNSGIPGMCSMIQLPIKSSQVTGELFDVLTAQFTLEWNVYDRGGQCASDSMNKFQCREKGHSSIIAVQSSPTDYINPRTLTESPLRS